MSKTSPLTRCVHSGTILDRRVGGVTTPIHTGAALLFTEELGNLYPRYNNIPTQEAVAAKIADLENAEAATVTGSGMSAISAVMLTFLGKGDHAVILDNVYGGTHHLVTKHFNQYGIEHTFVDGTNPDNIAGAIRENTKLIHIETPSNPLLKVVDIAAVAKLAKGCGALCSIDNTFASPINQNPLGMGVDIVIHSATKYLNGHNDLNCGAICCSRELLDRVLDSIHSFGPTLNVYDCYLLERGMKTLGLRMRQHNENGMAVAKYLQGHKRVSRVYYPGLPEHPGHDIAKAQMRGFGGMLSVDLDCTFDEAWKAVNDLKVFIHAVSLGGVESLACFPSLTTHEMMTPEERHSVGIGDTMVRFSVGIESTEDLIADLEQALDF